MDIFVTSMYIIIFVFGITVGSFLNVCIFRLPKGESVVIVPSHCVSCGKRLKWYELIPILSYVALFGKCSECKKPISAQYPLIETANGVLWMVSFHRFGLTPMTIFCALLASALLVLSLVDARTKEIPPGVTIFILALGAFHLFFNLESWQNYALGFIAVSIPLLILFYATGGRAIGGGDVKLMAACGLLIGWQSIILAFFMGCIIGSIVHIVRMRFFGAARELALGPYLAASIFICTLYGGRIIGWYIGLFA